MLNLSVKSVKTVKTDHSHSFLGALVTHGARAVVGENQRSNTLRLQTNLVTGRVWTQDTSDLLLHESFVSNLICYNKILRRRTGLLTTF